jgi:predicted PurR-regulated permease PerM
MDMEHGDGHHLRWPGAWPQRADGRRAVGTRWFLGPRMAIMGPRFIRGIAFVHNAQEDSDLYLRRIPWWYWAIFFGTLGLTFYLLGPILTPFLISFSLAYLLHPLVDRLERNRIPRSIGVSIVFAAGVLMVALGVLLLIPPLQTQIGRLGTFIPQATTWLQQEALPWLSRRLGTDVSRLDAGRLTQFLQDNFSQAGGIATNVATYLTSSGMKVAATLANLFLVPIVTFYMMRDWHTMLESLGNLVPRPLLPAVGDLARESDEVLAAFLRGQLLVMMALGSIYGIGFWIAGVEFAMLIGIFAGLVSFVPYLGVAMALISAMITAAITGADAVTYAYILVVVGIGQALEGSVITPLLVGDRIGLHPVIVIFLVLAGGQLFGFVGVLLALPLAAIAAAA